MTAPACLRRCPQGAHVWVPGCTNVNALRAPAHMAHACTSRRKCKESMLDTRRLLSSHCPGSETPECHGNRARCMSHSPPQRTGDITDQGLNSEEVRVLDTVSGQEGLQRAPRTRMNAKRKPLHPSRGYTRLWLRRRPENPGVFRVYLRRTRVRSFCTRFAAAREKLSSASRRLRNKTD